MPSAKSIRECEAGHVYHFRQLLKNSFGAAWTVTDALASCPFLSSQYFFKGLYIFLNADEFLRERGIDAAGLGPRRHSRRLKRSGRGWTRRVPLATTR